MQRTWELEELSKPRIEGRRGTYRVVGAREIESLGFSAATVPMTKKSEELLSSGRM
jgi:hypothetical protein